jgi:hypothetical protein
VTVNGAIDRESLRAWLRRCSEHERRIALERVVELSSDAEIERLLGGLIYLHEHRLEEGSSAPSLPERVELHVAATRRGEFRGEYEMNNAHGQREPWQTAAWLAATAHLFDCVTERARSDAGAETVASLRALTALVEEVDERADELVTFEEGCARVHFFSDLERAQRNTLGNSVQAQPEHGR